jgi:predicted MFS family arabinose efflux permease
MEENRIIIRSKFATQAIFLVCGFAISSWAPMVPLAKERLGLNDANLGYLLLMLGLGAIAMMPVSGYLSHKFGTRIVILISGLVAAIMLPMLLLISTPIAIGAALFVFGAGIGTIDVAMNAQGIHVQHAYGKQIMSSLHGLFSVGGLCSSLGIGALIKVGLNPVAAAVAIAILLVLILVYNYSRLFDKAMEQRYATAGANNKDHVSSTAPKAGEQSNGIKNNKFSFAVIYLGLACFVVFLSEGAILDWSALFLRESKNIGIEFAGVGYAAFSIAMATMRLLGDKIVERLSGKLVVSIGGLVGALGLFLAVATPWLATALAGFVLLGIGVANVVPVFFSEAGKIKGMASSIAITIISTMGYAGQLAGPAMLGFIAYHYSLRTALAIVAVLLCAVAIGYSFKKEKAGAGDLSS